MTMAHDAALTYDLGSTEETTLVSLVQPSAPTVDITRCTFPASDDFDLDAGDLSWWSDEEEDTLQGYLAGEG